MSFIIPFTLRPINLGQGFHGPSHRFWPDDKEDFSYSVDFNLPEGTAIIASQSGTVSKIKQDGTQNYAGLDPNKGEHAYLYEMNEIEIQHEDGFFASYCHLKHLGIEVSLADKIVQGQFIGYSGNTGWSSEPHLDFTVFRKNIQDSPKD